MAAEQAFRNWIITGEQLERMTGIGPCELVSGRIVPMTPTGGTHGRVEGNVYLAIRQFVTSHGIEGRVMVGEVGIYTRRQPDHVRAADVLYISNARLAGQQTQDGFLEVAPELVVEVLSPGDSASEFLQKLMEYFAVGVDVVIVVDPAVRRVRVHRGPTEFTELTDCATLAIDSPLAGFTVNVADLFA